MALLPGLPPMGSDVNVLITRVNSNPLCELVELWGNFTQERKADYRFMENCIQSPIKLFRESDGNPGDQCLVSVDDTWYRSRIVSRNGSNYRVFLFDKGWTIGATTSMLAWGKNDYFHLPPEVEFCLLSNVLPISPHNQWSPMALAFLKSLSGVSVKALVQDVLVPQRTFLLDIPCIYKQMHEMGFAKLLCPEEFKDYVLKSLLSDERAASSPVTNQKYLGSKPQGKVEPTDKRQTFMYPELPTGTVETVVITEVTNPLRVFCQLKVFSQELKKLTEQITQHYEGRTTACFVGPHILGSPCAARGSDGLWYRSILQHVLPANNMVEVFSVDYGKKLFVPVDNIKPLAGDFFRMPVVTYVTSLHGIIDKGVGWTASQIDYLRSLLLYKTLIVKFEYQSLSEGVHYVTLHEEDVNLNALFGSTQRCLFEGEMLLEDDVVDSSTTSAKAVKAMSGKTLRDKLPVEDLPHGSYLVAIVQHVSTPSEFWIQTQKYALEFDQLMDRISSFYRNSVNQDMVRNTTVGHYCVVKAQDGVFYRSKVIEVSKTQIKVFLVDYGKTEVVDRSNIHALPDEFRNVPQLALKCKLAGVKPKKETWSRKDIDFFSKLVTGKLLNVQVVTKCDGGYAVGLTAGHGEKGVSQMMCSYDFAEKDEAQTAVKCNFTFPQMNISVAQNSETAPLGVNKNSCTSFQIQNAVEPMYENRPAAFKEQMFPIGSSLDVNVSYIESPNDFWCQLVQNVFSLKLLMRDLQDYYADSQFQPLLETACVARHPDTGMWYRAVVVQKRMTDTVDVLFVDYGQTKTVSLYDLRRMCPAFLNLKGQAFRCSLYNPAEPASPMRDWNEDAKAQFQDFLLTAASNHAGVKCTIYALMYNEQKVVFNIVDLETPFESVCNRMVLLDKRTPAKNIPRTPFRLDTYCYSSHNIKMGMEELMTVTSVDNVNRFYCQLDRNFDVLDDLTVKLQSLCEQLKNAQLQTMFGTVCFAKYPDGHWYRGLIKATQPSIQVFFVDYGDTLEVDKTDILPVPLEATDIMSVPMQAIECGLADIPANVHSEVNSWFKSNATDYPFRALVVAKQPCGKLIVELYHGTSQVNSEIKSTFLKSVTICARELKDDTQVPKKTQWTAPKPVHPVEADTKVFKIISGSADNNTSRISKNEQFKSQPLEVYKTPHQRKMAGRQPNSVQQCPEPVATQTAKPRELAFPAAPQQQRAASKLHGTEPQKSQLVLEAKKQALAQHTDLSSHSLTSGVREEPLHYLTPHISEGQKMEAYVATITAPQSFWCQSADLEELDKIIVGVSKVGKAEQQRQVDANLFSHGSPCIALFTDDAEWYRAEVIGKDGDVLSVHFVDYGNDSQVNVKDLRQMPPELVKVPIQAFLCELDGFEDANGWWEDGAVDQISELLIDRLLQLNVVRLSRQDNGKSKCIVQVSCEGKVINDTVRAYWKSSKTEHPDDTGLSTAHSTSPSRDSSMDDTSVPLSQKEPECPETPITREGESLRDHTDEQCTVNPQQCKDPIFPTETVVASEPTIAAENIDGTDCSLQSASIANDEKEEADQILVKHDVADEPRPVTETQHLKELVSDQVVDKVPVIETAEAQLDDISVPPRKDGACQQETHKTNTEESVAKTEQDYEHEVTQIDDQDVGPSVPHSEDNCQDVMADSGEKDKVDMKLDSEFGQLKVAKDLPVGSTCVIWSPTDRHWCKARVLKNLKDFTMAVLFEEEIEMIVDPESIFEIETPESEQCDDDRRDDESAPARTAGSLSDLKSAHSDDTLAGQEEMAEDPEMHADDEMAPGVVVGVEDLPGQQHNTTCPTGLLQQYIDTTDEVVDTGDVSSHDEELTHTKNKDLEVEEQTCGCVEELSVSPHLGGEDEQVVVEHQPHTCEDEDANDDMFEALSSSGDTFDITDEVVDTGDVSSHEEELTPTKNKDLEVEEQTCRCVEELSVSPHLGGEDEQVVVEHQPHTCEDEDANDDMFEALSSSGDTFDTTDEVVDTGDVSSHEEVLTPTKNKDLEVEEHTCRCVEELSVSPHLGGEDEQVVVEHQPHTCEDEDANDDMFEALSSSGDTFDTTDEVVDTGDVSSHEEELTPTKNKDLEVEEQTCRCVEELSDTTDEVVDTGDVSSHEEVLTPTKNKDLEVEEQTCRCVEELSVSPHLGGEDEQVVVEHQPHTCEDEDANDDMFEALSSSGDTFDTTDEVVDTGDVSSHEEELTPTKNKDLEVEEQTCRCEEELSVSPHLGGEDEQVVVEHQPHTCEDEDANDDMFEALSSSEDMFDTTDEVVDTGDVSSHEGVLTPTKNKDLEVEEQTCRCVEELSALEADTESARCEAPAVSALPHRTDHVEAEALCPGKQACPTVSIDEVVDTGDVSSHEEELTPTKNKDLEVEEQTYRCVEELSGVSPQVGEHQPHTCEDEDANDDMFEALSSSGDTFEADLTSVIHDSSEESILCICKCEE